MAERSFTCGICGDLGMSGRRGPVPTAHRSCREAANSNPLSSEERSRGARRAALARWSQVPSVERSEIARQLARKRWGDAKPTKPSVRRPPRHCVVCDVELKARQKKCCGSECRSEHNRRRARDFNERWKAENGERYGARYNDQKMEQMRRWRDENREEFRRRSRKTRAKRRAIERGAVAEDFTHEEIFERDQWRCGLCGGKVDGSLDHPDPRSASLDHIVPFDAGGHHVRANVQCSHLECNLSKGTRPMGEQLRLIG